jgi:hypothetical protein
MTQTNSKDWVLMLPILLNNYNNVISRITGKTPNDLDKVEVSQETKQDINLKMKKEINKKNLNVANPTYFLIGDKVRLKVKKDQFEKLNGKNFTLNIFRIYKRFKPKNGQAEYYYVKDAEHKYTEKLYNEDLLHVKQVENKISEPDERWTISKLIKPKMMKNGNVYVPSYEVKWKGYKDADNTIEPRSQLIQDVPKLVNAFDKKHKVEWKARSVKYEKL